MSDEEYNGWYHTRYGFYPPDEKDSNIVTAANKGDLKQIKRILSQSQGSKKTALLNHAKKWTEVQEKCGYDKSWEWFGDTALISAARNGNFMMVKFLLLEGADPTLSSCPYDDEYETALKATQNRAKYYNEKLEKLKTGSYRVEVSELERDPRKFVEGILGNVISFDNIIKLLQEAEKYWDRASYAHARYSKDRAEAFVKNPNRPKVFEEYIKAIELVASESELDSDLVQSLATGYSTLQQKKRSLQPPAMTQHHQPQTPWMSSVLAQKKSNLVTNLSQTSSCPGCGKLPAKECVNHSCSRCCTGSCPRHGNDMPAMHNSFWWD